MPPLRWISALGLPVSAANLGDELLRARSGRPRQRFARMASTLKSTWQQKLLIERKTAHFELEDRWAYEPAIETPALGPVVRSAGSPARGGGESAGRGGGTPVAIARDAPPSQDGGAPIASGKVEAIAGRPGAAHERF